jgi:uncharacterized protein involved in exopolysaccharide biosynthesis
VSEFNIGSVAGGGRSDENVASRDVVELSELIRAVWRYRLIVLAATAVCGLSAAIIALTSKSVYRAQVVVTEARDSEGAGASSLGSKLGGLAAIAGISAGATAGTPSVDARAVLDSRHLVEEFIQRNNLVPVLFADRTAKRSLWRAVKFFREKVLAITEDKVKGTTTIAIDWTDPVMAAQWASGFVALANELIRARAMSDSARSIAYLNDQIAKTNVVELRTVMYDLIEKETKTLMLANGRAEYAFTTVDPAVTPEERIWPKRTVITAIGAICGFLIGVAIAIFRERRAY